MWLLGGQKACSQDRKINTVLRNLCLREREEPGPQSHLCQAVCIIAMLLVEDCQCSRDIGEWKKHVCKTVAQDLKVELQLNVVLSGTTPLSV